ncbi:MAG: gfo/Idh/MocA family oxidoreductase [Candidatus Dadabacteria bacterium]|nr:MAG: gfo/Idh/MocA family oxidoreductase [Candidatus Dadabacteria bacterium]
MRQLIKELKALLALLKAERPQRQTIPHSPMKQMLPGQQKLRAAVVGVGYLGRFHAEKYYYSPRADLVALVDPNSNYANELVRKTGAVLLKSVEELAALNIDCVSVATPTSTHYQVASYLLNKGINVLIEKPMTVTVEEGQKLCSLAESAGAILQVGHLERFNPAFREMKKVLTSPRFFEVRRIAPFKPRGHDVDVIRDLMIHDIDIVSHLVGEPITKIDAVGSPVLTKNIDIANARLEFKGGAVANISVSRAALKTERTLRVFQPDLYISLDFERKKLKIYQLSGNKTNNGFPDISVQEFHVDNRDALADEIDAFLDCIYTNKEPEVTASDGLRAVQLAEEINCLISAENHHLKAEIVTDHQRG